MSLIYDYTLVGEEWCRNCWTENRPNCDHNVEHCKKIMRELEGRVV